MRQCTSTLCLPTTSWLSKRQKNTSMLCQTSQGFSSKALWWEDTYCVFLFGVCCLACVVCCFLFVFMLTVDCWLLFVVCLVCVVCCFLFAVCCLFGVCVVCCLLFVVCCLLFAWCLLFLVVCWHSASWWFVLWWPGLCRRVQVSKKTPVATTSTSSANSGMCVSSYACSLYFKLEAPGHHLPNPSQSGTRGTL